MHHPKEAIIDGVKFVLIPEAIHDAAVKHLYNAPHVTEIVEMWREYDPEVFDGL